MESFSALRRTEAKNDKMHKKISFQRKVFSGRQEWIKVQSAFNYACPFRRYESEEDEKKNFILDGDARRREVLRKLQYR